MHLQKNMITQNVPTQKQDCIKCTLSKTLQKEIPGVSAQTLMSIGHQIKDAEATKLLTLISHKATH